MSEKNNREWELPGSTLSIGLSSYCQANCICCPHHTASIRNMNMEFDLFKKCVDEAAAHGLKYLDLCLLGDSLLHPDKEKMLSYVRNVYPDVKIYASSTGLSVETEFVCKYVDTLHVSFYGTSPDIWNKVHGTTVNGGGGMTKH